MSESQRLKNIIEKIHPKWLTREIKKYPDLISHLNDVYPLLTLKEQLYLFKNDLLTRPICAVKNCSNSASFFDNRYSETCSYVCANILRKQNGVLLQQNEKAKNTFLEKYGVDNPSKNAEIIKKRKQTNIERYGYDNGVLGTSEVVEQVRKIRSTDEDKNKKRDIIEKKYGVTNISHIDGHSDRVRNTIREKYGVDNISQRHLTSSAIKILNDRDKFLDMMTRLSISDMCSELGVCYGTIYKKILQFELKEPQQYLPEENLKKFFDEYNIRYEHNNRTIIKPLELDLYFPDYNIAIEHCGLFWHSEKYLSNDYHRIKYDLCKARGVRLITVFEDELNTRKNITLSTLKSIFGLIETKVYARNCKIQILDSATAVNFIENNHLQGGGKTASIHIGLAYNDDICAVMSFRKVNGGFELTRYCCNNNTTVVGGASRLFSYFIKQYNPIFVLSFSDNRWFDGNMYKTLKFSMIGEISSDYSYIIKNKRIHKFNFRKNKIESKFNIDIGSKTEHEAMLDLNIYRIYDCGKKKWIWKKPE